MNHALPPSEADDDAYIFIDHREEESSIAHAVSQRLAPEHALQVEEDDDRMSVVFQGVSHPIPLQFSPHDRYIMISSLAELLREHYRFFLLEPSLQSDTHGLLVVARSAADAWPGIPDHLAPLECGVDHFSGIRVPYLGHEDSAPDFAADRASMGDARDAMAGFVQALFTGKLSDADAAKMAAAVARNPSLKDAADGKSEAEMAAELQQALKEALGSAEVVESQRAMRAELAKLQDMTKAPPKPWWRFW